MVYSIERSESTSGCHSRRESAFVFAVSGSLHPQFKPARKPSCLVDHRKNGMAMAPYRSTENVLLGSIESDIQTLQRDGIVARKGAFAREFVERMREDMMTAFWEAIQHPGRAVGRGPRWWYVEVHPQAINGFTQMVTHPTS